MRILTRLEVRGIENVPLEGGLIVAANHVHFADPPILGAVLPRRVTFMAKAEVFRVFPLNLIIRAYDAVSVRRGQSDTGAIRAALRVLQEGKAFGIFPEGHRSKDGALQPAHIGAAMLAVRSGALILPVAISGTRTFLRWPNVIQRQRVVVTIGQPFRASPDASRTLRGQQVQVTNEIMRRIADLLPHEQRGVFGVIGVDGNPIEVPPPENADRKARIGRRAERQIS